MSVVDIRNGSGGRSAMNSESGEEVTSNSVGQARPKRSYPFLNDNDRSLSSNISSPRKLSRLEPMVDPRLQADTYFNNAFDLEEDVSHSLTSSRQQEQTSFQLPDDFLEPLLPDGTCSVDTTALICMPQSFHQGMVASGKFHQDCRQFWKAGNYTGLRTEQNFVASGMDHVRVHPKFLHSNATSHKWVLGALAELLDNAFDEIMNGATLVNVDMIRNPRNGDAMLLIEDDGGGMDPDCMRRCMSLGYSAKSKIANTIGQYGNGFKTSTMRLGADAIVFSRCSGKSGCSPSESIGLLSYTFLTGTGQDDIIVPIVDYEIHPFGLRKLLRSSADDWNKNMETLKHWSPYSSEAELLEQFKGMSYQGTRIIVYNLWEDEQGSLELDFMANPHDIQVRGANRDEKNIKMAEQFPNSRHYLTYRHSLRSYASILYLRLPSKFKIILRGKQVEHHRLSDDLMFTEEVTYKPQLRYEQTQKDATQMKAVVTIGFVKDAKEHIDVQGFSVYHKNRLIKPFWRIWNVSDTRGRGIIGILEANFVEPAHDKQGFERTIVLTRLETRLIEMQKNYWSRNCHKVGYINKSLRKDGKLIARKDDLAMVGLGLEKSQNNISHELDFTQELEVLGSVPSAATVTHMQDTFSPPAALELQRESFPVSTEIHATVPQFDSQFAAQMQENLASTRSLAQIQDIAAQSHSEMVSVERSLSVKKKAFSSRAMTASDSRSPNIDEDTRKRAAAEIINLDPSSPEITNSDSAGTRAAEHPARVESEIDALKIISSPEKVALSSTTSGFIVEQTNAVSVAGVDESRITIPEATSTACNSYAHEGHAVSSSTGPHKSVQQSDTQPFESLMLEIHEASVVLPSFVEKVVDASSDVSKATESSLPKDVKLLEKDSQMTHKTLEKLGQMSTNEADTSTLLNNHDEQEAVINTCIDFSQDSEVAKAMSLEKFCSSGSSDRKELKYHLSHVEEEVQFLRKSIEAVVGESDKLRQQLQKEHQLADAEMTDLKRQLERAHLHLENLKAENGSIQAHCIVEA